MPNYQVNITVDNVVDALADFLQPFVDPSEIVRAQGNRVSPPPGPFVLITELRQVDLETPIVTSQGESKLVRIEGPKRIDFQVDFYGPLSGDQCAAVKSVFRSGYTTEQFPDNVSPLYCSDGNQMPLITGEEQYESRWRIDCSLQYNPAVTIPQQFATKLVLNHLEDLP